MGQDNSRNSGCWWGGRDNNSDRWNVTCCGRGRERRSNSLAYGSLHIGARGRGTAKRHDTGGRKTAGGTLARVAATLGRRSEVDAAPINTARPSTQATSRSLAAYRRAISSF